MGAFNLALQMYLSSYIHFYEEECSLCKFQFCTAASKLENERNLSSFIIVGLDTAEIKESIASTSMLCKQSAQAFHKLEINFGITALLKGNLMVMFKMIACSHNILLISKAYTKEV